MKLRAVLLTKHCRGVSVLHDLNGRQRCFIGPRSDEHFNVLTRAVALLDGNLAEFSDYSKTLVSIDDNITDRLPNHI